jgi:glutamate-1-semialdehyde 2,1-aminomutase
VQGVGPSDGDPVGAVAPAGGARQYRTDDQLPEVAALTTDNETSLDAALSRARAAFVADHPASRQAHEWAQRSMPGGTTRSTLYYSPFPLVMQRGTRCRLTDIDGHERVDLLGEYTAGIYGHDNPVIRAAIDAALDDGWNFGAHSLTEAKLAAVLCERFPSLELVRFTNSGTEANMLALATALLVTGRSTVLVVDGGYHGSVLSFAGGGTPLNLPHRFVVTTYNDADQARSLVRAHGADLAAVLVEPMLGSRGCVPAEPGFLAALREAATGAGALLIFDEVMTSRMSSGGLQLRQGIIPDMTTLGKYVGGGMSFGAFGGSRDVMSVFDPRQPGSVPGAGTFNNNVLSMAAGYAGLSQVFTPDAATALFERGERLRHELEQRCAGEGVAMCWTGLGSLMNVHFQREPIRCATDIAPETERRELFHLEMLENGFYLGRRGFIALSLEIGEKETSGFVDAVTEFACRHRSVLT